MIFVLIAIWLLGALWAFVVEDEPVARRLYALVAVSFWTSFAIGRMS